MTMKPKQSDMWISRYRYQLYPVLAVVVFGLAWQVFVSITSIQEIYLPSPSKVGSALKDIAGDGAIVSATGLSIVRIYAGFLIAALIGVPAGLLMHSSRAFRSLADAFIAAFYPLPKIALIPPLVIWLGSGESYKLVISAVSALFPILVNTYLGVRLVDSGLIKAARDLGCTPFQIQRKVVLPGALPSILAGFQLGLGVSFVMVIAAEMLAGSDGIGYQLLYAGQLLQTDRVFALLLILTILGWIVTKLQQLFDRIVAPWA